MTEGTCTVVDCAKPVRVKSRGLCTAHYAKWQKYGDPAAGRTVGTNPETCTHRGCDRPYAAGGYCNAHYLRSRNGADMDAPIRKLIRDAEEAFEERTEWQGECLLWTGARNNYGYGVQSSGRSRAEGPILAHRYAWERECGPIPEGMFIDHICWNRACVNVAHLRLATTAENVSYRDGGNYRENGLPRNVYRKRGKFRVQVVKDGTARNFGVFETAEEAAEVAKAARQRLFGKYAGR